MKKTLIFVLSAIATQSYAAVQWNCTSPDIQQSYLPKECTGIGSGNTSANSGSSSATPNAVIYGQNLSACGSSTYDAYTESKIKGFGGDGNSICLDALVNNLNLPSGYSAYNANVMCTTMPGNSTPSCTISIPIRTDGTNTNTNIITLYSIYPADSVIKALAQKAGISDPNNILICDSSGSGVCPAGTYSYLRDGGANVGPPTGLKKN